MKATQYHFNHEGWDYTLQYVENVSGWVGTRYPTGQRGLIPVGERFTIQGWLPIIDGSNESVPAMTFGHEQSAYDTFTETPRKVATKKEPIPDNVISLTEARKTKREDDIDLYIEASDAIAVKIQEACKSDPVVIFSLHHDDDGVPVDKLDEVAFKGEFTITHKHDSFWGEEGFDYVAKVTDPTWLELCVLANECIHTVNDYHHIFFEDAQVVGPGKMVFVFGS